ncbi:periplasmic heavy metal sensor [Neotabrizicola sp. VNH66]|uniref:periplasmic heavy metal sensor n=1 Tax=Neotabrizicola sp. VNH66 TaxID=3400918 RepID=UPI003C118B77
MTDPVAPISPPPARTRGWVKALLAVSLALNLAVGGVVAGSYLRNGGPPRAERDIGLGPLAEALTREDWKALRGAFLDRHPDLKKGPEVLRADFDAVLAALRAEPFDPAAVDAALLTVKLRNEARLNSAREVIADYIKGLTPEARAVIADRLEKVLARGRKKDKDKHDD